MNKKNLILSRRGTILTTQKVDVICDKCGCIFQRKYFWYKKSKNIWNKDLCCDCIYSRKRVECGKRSTDKIGIKCKDCGSLFERSNFNQKVSFDKFGGDFCCRCINKIINSRGEVKEKHRRNGSIRISNMSKEERSLKYGNDSWKRNSCWFLKMGSRGYQGYYKNFFFRSFLELSFLIQNKIFLEEIKSAEKDINIKYRYKNVNKTYKPDFIWKNEIIEVKPLYQMDLGINKAKFLAAKSWCGVNGFKFRVITDKEINVLGKSVIFELIRNMEVSLLKKDLIRFQNKIKR